MGKVYKIAIKLLGVPRVPYEISNNRKVSIISDLRHEVAVVAAPYLLLRSFCLPQIKTSKAAGLERILTDTVKNAVEVESQLPLRYCLRLKLVNNYL